MEISQMNYEFCEGITHTIKKGDTLYEISRKHKVPLALLLRANPYVDVFNLQVGDTICIPTNQGKMTPYPDNKAMPFREPPVYQPEQNPQPPGTGMEEQGLTGMQRREDHDDDDDDCMVWEKYVVNPGDTLADVLADTKGDLEDFVERNGLANLYMLPGVAYYICK